MFYKFKTFTLLSGHAPYSKFSKECGMLFSQIKSIEQCMYRTHIQGMYATGQVIQTLTIFWPPNDYCHSGCKPQCTFPLSYTLFTDNSLSSAEQYQLIPNWI
jgi:hypothetical protein